MPGTRYDHISRILRQYDSSEKKILEIGCGSMQYRSDFQGSYFGLDRAESAYTEVPPHYIGYMEKMPVADETFDLVFAVATFYYARPAEQACAEVFRVLRPGGTVLIFDYDKPVLQRLEPQEGTPINVWGYVELKAQLARVGFPLKQIQRLSDRKFHIPGLFSSSPRRPLYHLKRMLISSDWLIVKATKPHFA